MKAYKDYSPAELNALKYEDLLRVRQAAYRVHVAGMSVNPEIETWAARMASKHGRFVQVWKNTVDWPTALLIVRWGEAPEHWPAEFGEDDVKRALTWEAGTRRAEGVTYLGGEYSFHLDLNVGGHWSWRIEGTGVAQRAMQRGIYVKPALL